MPATKIVKRTGEVVVFDRARIRNAVAKAIRAVGTEIDPGRLDVVVDRVIAEVDERFTDFFPNVENIQDIVEKHLVREGLYEIAKAYILYRADRQRERDAKKAQAIQQARVGRLTVQTRDGRVVLFNLKKCEESVQRLAADLGSDVSVDRVVQEAMRTIYDGIPTTQIERSLVLAAAAFIEQDPAYSFLAARLQLEALFKEVTGQSLSNSPEERDAAYRMSFRIAIRNGLDTSLFDERLRAFDLDALAAALKPERDWLFQYLGIQTLADRYLARHDGRAVEMPQAFWMRVAMGLAVNEPDRTRRAIDFYDLMSDLLYVPSTPTLFHAGTPHPQLSSCYLTTIKDDLAHIFKALSDNAQLSKWSGGLGNDWTNIRGTGSRIKSTKVESQGVVPFLKVANDVTMAINRSGKRRGATCAYLETWHYDIEDFLDLRRNTGDERRRTHDMNTSNWIPDLFMKRVVTDGPWTLFSPDEVPDLHGLYGRAFEKRYEEYEAKAARGEMALHKTIQASALWRKMLTMLFETGHPWITFKDPCNIRSPQDHVGVVHSSNLCTEITLNTSADETAVCNLGSINLARHIVGGKLDEARLATTVAAAIRLLDNVIDINYYPTAEAERSNFRHRPIGLGIMGFQDALFLLDIPYDSPAALDFADRMMEVGLVSRDSHVVEAGGGARRVRDVQGLEVGSRAVPDRHHRSAGARARHADRSVARAASRLGAGLRARQGARHAQLEHDGDCADGDDREHRGLLPVHRADLQEHLREGEHQRRVHGGERLPGARPEGARPVERRDARSAEVLRRQRADDRGHSGSPEGEVPRSVRNRSDRRAAVDRRARQVGGSEPVAQRVHEGHVGQEAERNLPHRLAARPEDDLLPAHARRVADREVDARRVEVRLHAEARLHRSRRRGGGRGRGRGGSDAAGGGRRAAEPDAKLCRIDDPDCEACQ